MILFRGRFRRCFGAALLCGVPLLMAANKPGGITYEDCRLTLQARDALQSDNMLEPLNLGVSVKSHVATLWGAVPSKDLAKRAVKRVRRVQGIKNVVNQLVVETAGDPLLEFLSVPPPLRAHPAPPPDALPAPVQSLRWQPGQNRIIPQEPPPKAPRGVTLLPIIPLPVPSASHGPPPAGLPVRRGLAGPGQKD